MYLEMIGLFFSYKEGRKKLIKDLTLSFKCGQLVALARENDSGKSTLLKLIAGKLQPEAGKVLFNGTVLTEDKYFFGGAEELNNSGQKLNELIASTMKPDKMINTLKELNFQAPEAIPLNLLSTGEKCKLLLALALNTDKDLILMDVPLISLSPRSMVKAWRLLKEHTASNKTIIISTSDMDSIAAFADRVVVLGYGNLILEGTPTEVLKSKTQIRDAGLRLPRVTHLVEILIKHEGFPIADMPYTISEARKALSNYRQYGKRLLRKGITTGTCAAAAAKAATAVLKGINVGQEVSVLTPFGKELKVPIKGMEIMEETVKAWVEKDGGDDPDVTNGIDIVATVRLNDKPGVVFIGGEGVGEVKRPGLALPVGEPAINPGPREMIVTALNELLLKGEGAEVEISIPDGKRLAKKTLNPKLGIEGGISILGTTGIVEPMSEEAFKNSLAPQIKQVQAAGCPAAVLAPGNMGQNQAVGILGFPTEAVIQMSNFVGFMLNECRRLGMNKVILFGHIGKLVKVSAGIFHTHSKVSDARLEIMSSWALKAGASAELCLKVLHANTTEEAVHIFHREGLNDVFSLIAEGISNKSEAYTEGEVKVGTILTSLKGDILGWDDGAKIIGEELGWQKQLK